MATIKKYVDKTHFITGQLMASAMRDLDGPWHGLVTFFTMHSLEDCETHYTPTGYATADEALGAAMALAARLFPPGEPRAS